MAPLRLAVIGILIVAIDLNAGQLDILLDPVGYLLIALAVGALADRHPGFRWAQIAMWIGVVVSTPALLLRTQDPESGAIQEHWLTSNVESALQIVFVIGVCTALMALARNPSVASHAKILRVALPVVNVLTLVISLTIARGLEGTDIAGNLMALASGAAALAIVLVLLSLGLGIWLLVTLWRAAAEPVLDRHGTAHGLGPAGDYSLTSGGAEPGQPGP